jgi:hypothetical protein
MSQDIRDKFQFLKDCIVAAAKDDPPPGGLPLVMATLDLLELFMLDVRDISNTLNAIHRDLPS